MSKKKFVIGKCVIVADNSERRVAITIHFDPKKKPGMNAGVLATVTNGVVDALRQRFCAHQIVVKTYREPIAPKSSASPKDATKK